MTYRLNANQIKPFLAMDVMRKAADLEAKGKSIIHLEVGQPAFPAPRQVIAAAQESLADGILGYTEASGIRALRRQIAAHYADHYDVEVPIDRIAITPGSSGAFNMIFLAALRPGDRVVLPTPGYPAYRNMVRALGLQVVTVETTLENGWMPTLDQIKSAHEAAPIHALLIASPNNPTGTMMTPRQLRQILAYCRRQSIWFISDEIYHGLVFDGDEVSALEFDDMAIVVNSFSKHFCMTGWRIGWTILPEPLVRPVECLSQSFFISSSDLGQQAAGHAFAALDEMEKVKEGYNQNRQFLTTALPQLGFSQIAPVQGAFYIYAGIHGLAEDSMTFIDDMLIHAGVAATPGLDFDEARGQKFIRLSFAGTFDDMRQAVDRLAGWLS